MLHPESNPFQLLFRSLIDRDRGYIFPCDGTGRVNLDGLSDRDRNDYFYARVMVGRELAPPAVEVTGGGRLARGGVNRTIHVYG